VEAFIRNFPSQKSGGFHLKNSLLKLIKWFCRQLTYNELASAVVIFHEILGNVRKDIDLKPEPKPPNFRQFRVDQSPLLEPLIKDIEPTDNWRKLKADYQERTGKTLRKVVRRGNFKLPEHCYCEHCNAPSDYLYLNDGKKSNQLLCKICKKLSPSHRTRRESKAKYYCPYCSYALMEWKHRNTETIFKCPNKICSHFKRNFAKLTPEELEMRKQNKYTPNFKLRYQYREYHLSPSDLTPERPHDKTRVDLNRIHNNYHVVGLVLSMTVNLGLSSRQTCNALLGLFGIKISHQTVINYVNASASVISPWLDQQMPEPKGIAAADETYIIINGIWHYTWFVVDSVNRAICGYNVSNSRKTAPALATLYNTYGSPEKKTNTSEFIADGLGSYCSATLAYNQQCDTPKLKRRTVVGLENINAESRKYRLYKQIVERLNRTYKFHTRPRAGFKDFGGATSLTTLFVTFYNFIRPHSFLKSKPPVELECLKGIELFPKQWEIMLKQALF
jgi:putative transposase